MKFKSAALVVLLSIGGSDARSARSSRSSVMARQTSLPQSTVIVPNLAAPTHSKLRRKSNQGHRALKINPRMKRDEPMPTRIENEQKTTGMDITNAELRIFDWLNRDSVFAEPVRGGRLRRAQSFESFARSYSSFF